MQVIDHICLFKVVESHYARENVKSQFLPENLSVTEMHRMYIKWCSENNHKAEDYKFYYRVFTEQFDLKFQKPKKDKCDQCTAFNNTAIVNRMPEIVENNKQHIAEKIAARAYKNKLKAETEGSTDTIVVAFDLQKVLLCPHGETSSFYYSRRLKVHNFTVTNINTMETSCFLWTEVEAKKGACEVATSYKRYIKAKANEGVKKIHGFCDRCGGQNNNRMIILMISEAI